MSEYCRSCNTELRFERIPMLNNSTLISEVGSFHQSVTPTVYIKILDTGDGPFEGERICPVCICELLCTIAADLAKEIEYRYENELTNGEFKRLSKIISWKDEYDDTGKCSFSNITCIGERIQEYQISKSGRNIPKEIRIVFENTCD